MQLYIGITAADAQCCVGLTRCGSLPPPLLLRLTQHLAATAADAAGGPMLHELAAAAGEWLADGQRLRSPAPPQKPAVAAPEGGDGQALQHIAQVEQNHFIQYSHLHRPAAHPSSYGLDVDGCCSLAHIGPGLRVCHHHPVAVGSMGEYHPHLD